MKPFTFLLFAVADVATFASARAYPDPPARPSCSGTKPAAKPAATGSRVEQLKSRFSPDYKRVKVTYGTYTMAPFNAPAAHDSDPSRPAGSMAGMEGSVAGGTVGGAMPGMEDEGGILDASTPTTLKPCSDCTLKYAMSSLNYPDGSVANIDTGAWLHHLTMSVVGPGRSDLACPGGTMRVPKNTERMLAFHNDRNETFFGVTATDKMGFYLGASDVMNLELMLKNELNVPKDVIFSIEWEYIPGRPQGWSDVKGLWLDIAPCSAMMSDIPPPVNETRFTLEGPAWVSNIDGTLLNTVGHMHDGGLEVNILSGNKSICKSQATYDGKPEYIPSAQAITQGATKMSHISSYSPCIGIGQLKKGDTLSLSASYDFDKWKPGFNKVGEESHVMGVAMVFVEVNKS